MGCCGCNNKSSAITAGILGIIQALIGLGLDIFFISIYSLDPTNLKPEDLDDRLFLLYATRGSISFIWNILVVAAVIHSFWILSSIALLIGNAQKNVCCVRQWVVMTSFIIISDIVLPTLFLICTVNELEKVVESLRWQYSGNDGNWMVDGVKKTVAKVYLNYYSYYIVLALTFTKLGPITFIINVCLNVFTNHRASELNRQPGYVLAPPVYIVPGQTYCHLPPGSATVMNNVVSLPQAHTSTLYGGPLPSNTFLTQPSGDQDEKEYVHSNCNNNYPNSMRGFTYTE